MQRIRESTVDISQTPIKVSLVQYLNLIKASDSKDAPKYDHASIDSLIKKLSKGHCSGFAAVAAYSMWLQCQPVRTDETGKPIPRDDWEWYKSTLENLSRWLGLSLPPPQIRREFERLLSLIKFFQDLDEYLPTNQGELHKSMEDTRDVKPIKEYSLAGLLTLKKLKAILPKILHQDRVIFISSHNHDTCLFVHDNTVFYYDSNYRAGVRFYKTHSSFYQKNRIKQLAKDIFTDNEFKDSIPSPLGFRVFSFDGKPGSAYPLVSKLLKNLPLKRGKYGLFCKKPPDDYAKNKTAMHIATWIACTESTELYANKSQPSDLNQITTSGHTPVHTAIFSSETKVLRILAEKGADLNITTNNGSTPAYLLSTSNRIEDLRFITEKGVDLNKSNNFGATPVYIAAQKGHVAAVRLLAGNRCGLIKIPKAPTLFSDIERFLHNKDTILLHNDKLYYADVNKKEVIELAQTDLNRDKYQALTLACNSVYQEASCDQMNLITSLTGRIPTISTLQDLPIEASVEVLLEEANKHHREAAVKDLFAKKGITEKKFHGFTPLHAAIFFGHTEVVKELIALNFDIHRATQHNISGLEFAIAMNQVETIRILQEAASSLDSAREAKAQASFTTQPEENPSAMLKLRL